jgi:hypothetical protein
MTVFGAIDGLVAKSMVTTPAVVRRFVGVLSVFAPALRFRNQRSVRWVLTLAGRLPSVGANRTIQK